jgi:hypothetical protein
LLSPTISEQRNTKRTDDYYVSPLHAIDHEKICHNIRRENRDL